MRGRVFVGVRRRCRCQGRRVRVNKGRRRRVCAPRLRRCSAGWMRCDAKGRQATTAARQQMQRVWGYDKRRAGEKAVRGTGRLFLCCRSLSLTPAASTILALCHAETRRGETLTGPAINSHNTALTLTLPMPLYSVSLSLSLSLLISLSISTVDMGGSLHRSPRRPSRASTPHRHLHLRVPPVLQSA
jgi:hypothetical protein